MLLALHRMMRSKAALVTGDVTGPLWAWERRRRRSAERLAAAVLETLLNAIEANDHETGQHVRRVARYSMILGDGAGLGEHELRALERIALFHDIGKIHEALFDVIHDDAKLTPVERGAIATHPLRGAEVLAPLVAFYPELGKGVIAHHERWDGSGYPRGLSDRRIPFNARIVAVADTFDVIANGRHYRRAGGAEAAAMEIACERGTQFDPDIVDLLVMPPVLEQFAHAHQSHYRRRAPARSDRRSQGNPKHNVPDVRFRWRSSLESTQLRGAPSRTAG